MLNLFNTLLNTIFLLVYIEMSHTLCKRVPLKVMGHTLISSKRKVSVKENIKKRVSLTNH